MSHLCRAVIGAMLAASSAALAQTATPMPAPVAPLVVGAPDAVLRIGTKVPLRLSEELTTKGKALRVGQHFNMETVEPVLVSGMTVIPAGSPATGEITEVRNKGMWGKSGHLTAQMLYVTVGGRQVRLTGTFDDKGVTGTAGVVGAVALVPIAGFFVTGTSARIPLGAAVTGFVGEDVPVAMATAPAPPMAQPASPPATEGPVTAAPTSAEAASGGR